MDPAPPRRRARRAARAALALSAAFLLANAAVAVRGLLDAPAPCDVAVVLGARVRPDGTPSVQLHDRLTRGLDAWRRGEAGLVMVSGGLGVEGHEEADVMAAWLIARGVPPDRVVVDRDGWTTWHTAVNTRALLEARGLQSALVVTSYYHVPRSKLAFERAGVPRVATARAVYRPARRDVYSLPREVVGLVWYGVRPHGGRRLF
ncbi:MAG: YdcF family protein [Planctomycetes bacterium]|nr:YdcF family protein [Planctomycetota bacterium]